MNSLIQSVVNKGMCIHSSIQSIFRTRHPALPLLLEGVGNTHQNQHEIDPQTNSPKHNNSLTDCLWLAVPKRKVTRGKKRMKTTLQKRIKKKDHIIIDSRTGEMTLRHRLPLNWKEYLTE